MKSEVMIHDIDAGTDELVLATSRHVEAPNWIPDGSALIVNGDGLLYRLPLSAPELEPIDTGRHDKLNNDHGISPDGQTLVISDKVENGQSCIYTLPATGGTPVRITQNTPSYWHGWSPDGQTLAYTARRDGAFDIFTIPVAGGEETRLTGNMGHCDGPDYTPDGEWIWYNADKTGSAQLWRMRTDGSENQQMTDDARVNWFPHPSPDGERIVFLSYPTGTSGHPGGLDVELRLITAQGGHPETIVKLHGGQGTINVPSWSPDSRRFAYVRYEKESS